MYQCGLCAETFEETAIGAHVDEKHHGCVIVPLHNVYRMSVRCSVCGETREYQVSGGLGPDYSPSEVALWHSPCPNRPKHYRCSGCSAELMWDDIPTHRIKVHGGLPYEVREIEKRQS